jgi:hypothetical protein
MKRILGIIPIILLVAAGCNKAATVSQTLPQPSVATQNSEPTTNAPQPNSGSACSTDLTVGLHTCKSDVLGLTFQYWQVGNIIVAEQGNTIKLDQYDGSIIATYATLTVFPKEPSQTLTEAVESQLLNGKPNVCEVVTQNNPPHGFNQEVYIEETDWNTNSKLAFYQQNKCGPYETGNSSSGLVMNASFPDRFYYFDFGQDAVADTGPDNNTSFDTTITLLPTYTYQPAQ